LEVDEIKSTLQHSERDVSKFKKQVETNDGLLQSINMKHVQLQNKITGLTETVQSPNRTAQVVCEKQKQLQTTIDDLTKTEETNNRTVQELLEKQRQFQASIDEQKETVEALNQTVLLLCEHPKDVSTCKLEAVATNKWTAVPPAINRANLQTNTLVSYTYSASIIRGCVSIFISHLCPLPSTPSPFRKLHIRSALNCKGSVLL